MSTLRVDTITDEAGTGAPNFPNGATGLDAFKYNAVSGATQDLNLDNGNFFDAGTLTADTTVSFSNVPTEARWTYTAEIAQTAAYDLTSASYVRTFSVAVQETGPVGVSFKSDGTAMYVVGSVGDDVNEYSLSIAWNISTASYVKSFSVGAQESLPTDLFFKPDGTVMYVTGASGDDVNEYSLSTAWDISTASYVRRFSVVGQDNGPQSVFFRPDGTAMYITGTGGDAVYEYSLSTAWNVATSSYVRTFSVAAQESTPTGISFKPDGTAMFVLGNLGDAVYEYSLSTAWNISTASYVRSFSVGAQEPTSQGLFFKPDGTAMYVVGSGGAAVYEYSTAEITTITTPAAVQNPPTETTSAGNQVSYTFYTADGGTNVYLINEEVL